MSLKKVLGPDIPQNALVFLFFWVFLFFFEVFGFLVVLVAGKSFRNQKPKKTRGKPKKPKKPMSLKKVLGPDIPQNALVFLVFWVFLVFFEVFGFLVVLIADKSFRNQWPQEKRWTPSNSNQTNNTSKNNSWPRHSWYLIFWSEKKRKSRENKNMQNGGPHSAAFCFEIVSSLVVFHQPIWKIWVKLENFPYFRNRNKTIFESSHHLVTISFLGGGIRIHQSRLGIFGIPIVLTRFLDTSQVFFSFCLKGIHRVFVF